MLQKGRAALLSSDIRQGLFKAMISAVLSNCPRSYTVYPQSLVGISFTFYLIRKLCIFFLSTHSINQMFVLIDIYSGMVMGWFLSLEMFSGFRVMLKENGPRTSLWPDTCFLHHKRRFQCDWRIIVTRWLLCWPVGTRSVHIDQTDEPTVVVDDSVELTK